MLRSKIVMLLIASLLPASLVAAELNTPTDIEALARSNVGNALSSAGDDPSEGVADAACATFQAGLDVAFEQATSAYYTVLGGMAAASSAGADLQVVATAIGKGIEGCLNTRLDYEVAVAISQAFQEYMAGSSDAGADTAGAGTPSGSPGLEFTPTATAYNPPVPIAPTSGVRGQQRGGGGGSPGFDTDVCVSNCI